MAVKAVFNFFFELSGYDWRRSHGRGCGSHIGCDKTKLPFEQEISTENLTYGYPDSPLVLENFSCIISKGEYVGFRGSSGIGKSTLFNLLIGLLTPSSGRILIDGTPLSTENRKAWMKHIGYVHRRFSSSTVHWQRTLRWDANAWTRKESRIF